MLALFLCAAAPLHAAPQPAPLPPIERFFATPALADAALSPSGRYLAAIAGAAGRRDYLVVIDLQAKTGKLVAGYNDVDIQQFTWVNDERLVFNVTDHAVAPGAQDMAAGLYAVNRDGSKLRQLADRRDAFISEGISRMGRKMLPWHTFLMDQHGAQNSDAIYVESYEWEDHGFELRYVNLLKLDTVTGVSQVVPRPARVTDWTLDQKGEPRLARASEKGVTTVYYLDPATSAWRVLTTYQTYGGGKGAFTPPGFRQRRHFVCDEQ